MVLTEWTPARGAPLTYKSVAGFLYDATLLVLRADKTADILVDAGPGQTLELTRIPLVYPDKLERSSCCRRGHR